MKSSIFVLIQETDNLINLINKITACSTFN